MTLKKYDLIMGLGAACSCSMTLRAAGLQLLSFPFDWAGPGDDLDLPIRIDDIAQHFEGWFNREDLVRGNEVSEKGAIMYRNMRTKHIFPHDFLESDDFNEKYPLVARKYERRIERMYTCIQKSKRVLLVRMDTPVQPIPTPLSNCEYALDHLSEQFPGVTFDFCLFKFEKGRPANNLTEEHVGEHITLITFDYKDYKPGMPPYSVDMPTVVSILKSHFSVRDYRTRAERKADAIRRRQAKWRANGASSALEYRMIKLRKKFAWLFGSGQLQR